MEKPVGPRKEKHKKIFSTVAECLILPSLDVVDTTRRQVSHTLGKNIPALGLAHKNHNWSAEASR
jgi:hypothetical protein